MLLLGHAIINVNSPFIKQIFFLLFLCLQVSCNCKLRKTYNQERYTFLLENNNNKKKIYGLALASKKNVYSLISATKIFNYTILKTKKM